MSSQSSLSNVDSLVNSIIFIWSLSSSLSLSFSYIFLFHSISFFQRRYFQYFIIINHWTQYFDVWIQNGYDRSIVLPTKWFCNKVPLSTVLSSSCFFFLQLIIHLYDRFCSFFRSLLFSLLPPHHFSFRLTFVRWTSGSRPRSILAEITTLCRAW